MARNRSRTGVSRGTPARRKWVWARANAGIITIGANLAVFVDLLGEFQDEYGADLLGATIMRIRGEVKVNNSAVMAVRIYTPPEDGVAGYTAANEGINVTRHADWMVYQPLFLDVTTGVRVKEIDVKSARKMDELGQSLLMVIESGGAEVQTSWDLSVGLKLP